MGTTAAHAIPLTAAGTVPVAFVGRTSTVQMQDPVASLRRQMRRAAERLPAGFYIARWYWDVESGGTDLDERSKSGAWEQFTAAGLPRDGGMAQLREEITAPRPAFAAVICENIERSGRDMFDALRLERELRKAGIPVFATDEPIDTAAPEASTILVRRVKQGMAEYFRYNVKAQLWEGLKQYAAAGYNTGPCPYGYAEERTAHPNPMKRNMGATRARLVPDPQRGPWVTRMFEWRVYEKLDCNGIARRLTSMGAPPPRAGSAWGYDNVYSILKNPKYAGRVVLGRTRNAGTGRRPGEKRITAVPREQWTWAADGNEHPALVSTDLWEQAQETGRKRGKVADHTASPAGRNLYALRSRITCAQCHRRMCGLTAPGASRTYYVCPHNPNNPRDDSRAPGHIRAAFRDTTVYAAVDDILRPLLNGDRAAAYTAQIPAGQAERDALTEAKTARLRKAIAQADTAISGLMTQLEQLGSDDSPASNAYRQRIRDQFTQRYDQRTTAQAELDQLTAERPPAEDPSLIAELPRAAELLDQAPADIRARIYGAFQVHVLYRAPMHQATITATITDATPGIIAALLADARTDHDTHNPARKNPAKAAITPPSLRDARILRNDGGAAGPHGPVRRAAARHGPDAVPSGNLTRSRLANPPVRRGRLARRWRRCARRSLL
jgi:site-specific DNA recombinase